MCSKRAAQLSHICERKLFEEVDLVFFFFLLIERLVASLFESLNKCLNNMNQYDGSI